MIICKTVQALDAYLSIQKNTGKKLGFVPTMGALHNGHLALVAASKAQTAVTVCSIFINPTQFNSSADFEKYPVTIETDILLLTQAGCDVLFLPSVAEMYPDGVERLPHYNLGFVETILEGKHRPGHFQGVCQVVHRLLQIVAPNVLFMGQKDVQQCLVVSKLIELAAIEVTLVTVNTLREPSGLAMSSRNVRLSSDERSRAVAISEVLIRIQQQIAVKPLAELIAESSAYLLAAGFETVDYVAICHAATLENISDFTPNQPTIALVAASIGGVRLIDNLNLN